MRTPSKGMLGVLCVGGWRPQALTRGPKLELRWRFMAVSRPLTEAYWEYMRLRDEYGRQPQRAVRWWMADATDPELSPAEQLMLAHFADAERVLDIGAGDLRMKARFQAAGFAGCYETTDQSPEFEYDYRSLEDAPTDGFDAVVVLEVIEHIPLDAFDDFVDGVLRVLKPNGRLVLSTPNASCIKTIWAGDMTHRHPYRSPDLAAYLHLRGVESEIHRVTWRAPSASRSERVRYNVAKVLARIQQVDYAEGVFLLGRAV